MSEPRVQEIPLVFQCEGETLVGIVHRPATPMDIGVVTIIAGGPQYRAGVGRGMVSTARGLAECGVPVLRFDHRGLGDGSGEFRGFEDMAEDLRAAVSAFRRAVPEVKRVVLWGGCDAASSAMIHGWKIPDVVSLVLGNPWVTTTETQAAVMKQHYLSRLRERSFWRKLLKFEYNIVDYVVAGCKKITARLAALLQPLSQKDLAEEASESENFVARMLDGLHRFEGPVLFLMSGQSLLSKEFDELLSIDRAWGDTYRSKACKRIDLPQADQTFSDSHSRESVNRAISEWLDDLR